MKARLWFSRALACAALLAGAAGAFAQQFPDKPIRWIVPYPPGGSTDFVTRIVAQKMQEQWGQPVVVENRGGASGIIGVEAAANAAPDGYTLLMTASRPHAINPSLFRSSPTTRSNTSRRSRWSPSCPCCCWCTRRCLPTT